MCWSWNCSALLLPGVCGSVCRGRNPPACVGLERFWDKTPGSGFALYVLVAPRAGGLGCVMCELLQVCAGGSAPAKSFPTEPKAVLQAPVGDGAGAASPGGAYGSTGSCSRPWPRGAWRVRSFQEQDLDPWMSQSPPGLGHGVTFPPRSSGQTRGGAEGGPAGCSTALGAALDLTGHSPVPSPMPLSCFLLPLRKPLCCLGLLQFPSRDTGYPHRPWRH